MERDFPAAVPHAQVTGDVCMERLEKSRHRKFVYRAHYGIAPEQRLIVLSSSFGPNSLAVRHLDFVRDLLDRLPDTFRVAVVAHPNLEFDNGIALSTLLDKQRANGLIMTEPEEWRDLSIAADLVIGDMGSTTFYSAAIGKPVATLPGIGTDDICADSPLHRFREALPLIDEHRDLGRQLEALIDGWTPLDFDFTQVLAKVEFSTAQRLAEIVHELLELESAPRARVKLIPSGTPLPGSEATGAFSVVWDLDRGEGDRRCYPATEQWRPGSHRLAEGAAWTAR
nr:hypothetical protein GCM10025732_03860 [Glycomyces mayteni]